MTVHRDGRYETTAARALWFCVDCGAVVPVDAREIHDRTHDDQPRPTLAELQARYLEVRGHTLSIDVWTPIRDALADQAEYVLDEARELLAAVQARRHHAQQQRQAALEARLEALGGDLKGDDEKRRLAAVEEITRMAKLVGLEPPAVGA